VSDILGSAAQVKGINSSRARSEACCLQAERVLLLAMLDAFITENNDEIIARVAKRVASRAGRRSKDAATSGIPVFLKQLGAALRLADKTDQTDHDEIRKSAGEHGDYLLEAGVDIEEVVHEYGDVCQTITELTMEKDAPIPTEEFKVMNLCLDDAIAEAVSRFAHESASEGEGGQRELAHQMRSLLATASTSSMRSGAVRSRPAGSPGRSTRAR